MPPETIREEKTGPLHLVNVHPILLNPFDFLIMIRLRILYTSVSPSRLQKYIKRNKIATNNWNESSQVQPIRWKLKINLVFSRQNGVQISLISLVLNNWLYSSLQISRLNNSAMKPDVFYNKNNHSWIYKYFWKPWN